MAVVEPETVSGYRVTRTIARTAHGAVLIGHDPEAGVAVLKVRHGAEAIGTDWVVFLDDDMTVNDDFLSAHALFHRTHPGEVAIGDIRFGPQIVPSAITRYIESRGAQRFADGASLPFKCFVTGNSSLERTRLLNVGLFDESLIRNQDAELNWRLRETGKKRKSLA